MAFVAWTMVLRFTALTPLPSPTWKALSLHLTGHWEPEMTGVPPAMKQQSVSPPN
jgi:hypothetical protein